jgi:hypothetical protein
VLVVGKRWGSPGAFLSQREGVLLRMVCTRRQAYRVVSPSCFDVRPTVISGKDGGGQLRSVCRRWCETGILLGVVRDRARVVTVTVVRAVDV